MDLILKEEAYKIIGAAMEVHSILGCGFLEAVYHEALEIEFKYRGIPFESEKLIEIQYKGHNLKKFYQADFICFGKIIVEIKALSDLMPENEAQIINYLKSTSCKLGLLINFGNKSLEYKRFVY